MENAGELIELSGVTDVYADGLHRIELLGENIRIVYFRWRLAGDGARWEKVAADFAFVIPYRAIKRPIEEWGAVPIIGPPFPAPPILN